jgi:hypothetical protein
MTKKKKGSATGSSKSATNAAARKARAAVSAVGFVSSTCEDVQADAIESIDQLWLAMHMLLSLAWENPQMHMQQSMDQLSLSMQGLESIKICLGLEGSSAVNTVQALERFLVLFPNLKYEEFFRSVGLDEQCKDCFRAVQDAVAMKMILFPETFQIVMDMPIHPNLCSKLKHSHCIMKRYVRDVAQILLNMSREHDLGGEEEPAVDRPRQAGSSNDSRLPALEPDLGGEREPAVDRPQPAGSSNDTPPPGIPPAVLGRELTPAQLWLDEAVQRLHGP